MQTALQKEKEQYVLINRYSTYSTTQGLQYFLKCFTGQAYNIAVNFKQFRIKDSMW